MTLPGFPNSNNQNWRHTSNPTWEYNCLSWSVHRSDVWIWPDIGDQFSWPPDMVRGNTIATFRAFFERIGFVESNSGALEQGIEKIALYARGSAPEHFARQLASGKWTSKLSGAIDIEHDSLTVLEDGDYGRVQLIMARVNNGPPNLPPLHPPPPLLIRPNGMPLIP